MKESMQLTAAFAVDLAFGIPCFYLLRKWRRYPQPNIILFPLSCVNGGSILLWQCLIALLAQQRSTSAIRVTRAQQFPIFLAGYIWPAVGLFGSLALVICSAAASKGRRAIPALLNLLIFVWWIGIFKVPNLV